MVSAKILSSTNVFNIDNYSKCFLSIKSERDTKQCKFTKSNKLVFSLLVKNWHNILKQCRQNFSVTHHEETTPLAFEQEKVKGDKNSRGKLM